MHADLRDWLEQVDGVGELIKVSGAHWDKEMGSITQLAHEDNPQNPPALLFDDIPGYPPGYRTLYGTLSSPKRFALTCGLEIKDYPSKVELLRNYRYRIASMEVIKPRLVNDGPVLENVHTGNRLLTQVV